MHSGGKTKSKQSRKGSVLTTSHSIFDDWLKQTDGQSYAHLACSHVIMPDEVSAEGSHCLCLSHFGPSLLSLPCHYWRGDWLCAGGITDSSTNIWGCLTASSSSARQKIQSWQRTLPLLPAHRPHPLNTLSLCLWTDSISSRPLISAQDRAPLSPL